MMPDLHRALPAVGELLPSWAPHPAVVAIIVALAAAGVAWGATVAARRITAHVRTSATPAHWFYATAAMSMLVSADTSWRFFHEVIGIESLPERIAMFGVVEVALVACGVAMHRNAQQRPQGAGGAPRMLAWSLCAFAGFAALALSGPIAGLARVLLGPVLGVVALHMALGIELRKRHGGKTTSSTIASVLVEVRERLVSRLGLADEGRTAVTRTRDRAVRRAARLAHTKKGFLRKQRLVRALRQSNVAHNEHQRDQLLDELAMLQHADALATLEHSSPWTNTARGTDQRVADAERRAHDAEAATRGAEQKLEHEIQRLTAELDETEQCARRRESEIEQLRTELDEAAADTSADDRTAVDWDRIRWLADDLVRSLRTTRPAASLVGEVVRAFDVSPRWVQLNVPTATKQREPQPAQ